MQTLPVEQRPFLKPGVFFSIFTDYALVRIAYPSAAFKQAAASSGLQTPESSWFQVKAPTRP